MNRDGEFAVVWRQKVDGKSEIYAQRYEFQQFKIDDELIDRIVPVGGEIRANEDSTGEQGRSDVAIDENGNVVVIWAGSGIPLGDGYSARWFDKWGNLLADEFRVADVSIGPLGQANVAMAPDGEFVIAWPEQDAGGMSITAQRYTLRPPTVLDVAAVPTTDGDGIVVGFSQEMATSGAGSVLEPSNWALRLADGRYLVQADPTIQGTDPRATTEQFGAISFGFNAVAKRWEATLPLNFILTPGTYQLIPRSSLQDAAGRRLDGNGDGIPSENFTEGKFTIVTGDYDRNNVVNQADYNLWRQHFGATSGGGLRADGNGNGVVDTADYVVWRANLGRSFSQASVANEAPVASPQAAVVGAGRLESAVQLNLAPDGAATSARSSIVQDVETSFIPQTSIELNRLSVTPRRTIPHRPILRTDFETHSDLLSTALPTVGTATRNSSLAVLDLLYATDDNSQDGVLYGMDDAPDADDDWEAVLRTLANDVYSAINEAGEI
jgi:hypothetical protein